MPGFVSVPTAEPAARFSVPPLVKVVRPPLNVVGPNTLMVPLLLILLEPANVLVPSVFQMPALIKLLLALPVIETVPVTTPPALLIKIVVVSIPLASGAPPRAPCIRQTRKPRTAGALHRCPGFDFALRRGAA